MFPTDLEERMAKVIQELLSLPELAELPVSHGIIFKANNVLKLHYTQNILTQAFGE